MQDVVRTYSTMKQIRRTHLEVAHRHNLLNSDLEHLHHLARKAPDPDKTVRALLGVCTDDKEGGVVLHTPEVQTRSVFEGADGVVGLGEGDGVRLLELVLCGRTVEKEVRRWAQAQ